MQSSLPPSLPISTLLLPLRLRLDLKKTTHLLHPTRIHLLERLNPPPLTLLLALLILLLPLLLFPLRDLLFVFFDRAFTTDIV